MPTMASVKLSTGRPIVNHPHYEDSGLRERTKLVYSMYSRMTGQTVRGNLMKLGVDYFVLEDSWPGCSMPEIWDIEDPQNVGQTPFCTHMSKSSRPHFATIQSPPGADVVVCVTAGAVLPPAAGIPIYGVVCRTKREQGRLRGFPLKGQVLS
ncbi:hypothetical protein FQN60_017278, partial [Etheostoma spectabile]